MDTVSKEQKLRLLMRDINSIEKRIGLLDEMIQDIQNVEVVALYKEDGIEKRYSFDEKSVRALVISVEMERLQSQEENLVERLSTIAKGGDGDGRKENVRQDGGIE